MAPEKQPYGDQLLAENEKLRADLDRTRHAIYDALKFLPPPGANAGSAILRGQIAGTLHGDAYEKRLRNDAS